MAFDRNQGPIRVGPKWDGITQSPGPAPLGVVPRAPNTAPFRPPFQLARGWTGKAITDTSGELVPQKWTGFTTGKAPAPIQQSWTQNLLESTLAPPAESIHLTPQAGVPIAPARLQQAWSSPGITDTSQELVPFAWRGFQVPQRATPILQEWTPGIPTVMMQPPIGARSGGLGARLPPVAGFTWSTNLLQSTLQPVTTTPFSNEYDTPRAPYRLPQGWSPGQPFALVQASLTTYVFRQPMQSSVMRHYDRPYFYAFESISYANAPAAAPDNVIPREPNFSPRHAFIPYRMPQNWDQESPLPLISTFVTPRAPMEAPDFHAQLLAWRQAWNPNNLLPLQATIAINPRYHVIGSFVVRRFK